MGEVNWETAIIESIIDNDTLKLLHPVTPYTGRGVYAWQEMTVGDYSGENFQQSPTCDIVGAQLKKN